MKKGIKILIGTLVSFVVLVIIYIILIISGIVPNPFLDTKDLVCKKTNDQISFTYEEVVTIKFNKFATVKEVQQKEIYVFLNEQEAKDYYEQESDNKYFDYEIEGNKVTISISLTGDDGIDYNSVTKKQIKKRYIEEYSYDCE